MQAERFSTNIRFAKPFWTSLLVASPFLLLPIGRSSELPVAIMAIGGIWKIATTYSFLVKLPQLRYFSLLFLLIWLPVVLSYPDSANTDETLRVAISTLRFYFAGLFIIATFAETPISALVSRIISWLVLFLLFDGLIQVIFGIDLFGYPYPDGRVNGPFGENLKLGLIVAVLSPFVLFSSSSRINRVSGVAVLGLLLLITLLSGSRASWVMLTVSIAGYLYLELRGNQKRALTYTVLLAILLPVGSLGIYLGSDYAKQRVDTTLLLFEGDRASVDSAFSSRLPIWEAAVDMFANHPLNGIGARSFRDAYFDYAADNDPFLNIDIIPTHPHQIFLEVGAETGVIGLASLLAFYILLFGRLFKARINNPAAAPFAVALLAALFPLNTHLALYSSFWGMIIWLLIALFSATMKSEPTRLAQ